MKVVTSGQMRNIEKLAIEELEIPPIILMENAAIKLAEHCFRFINNITANNKKAKVLVICGSGNNGGDGMALARHLYIKNIETKIIYMGDVNTTASTKNDQANDAVINLKITKNLGIPIIQYSNKTIIKSDIEAFDLVVDALLGTGLDRNVEGKYKELIEEINCYAKYIISVDIPSGVHSDSGRIMGCAVKANETVTFAYPKVGLYAYPGAEYAGKIHIEDISIPHHLMERIETKAQILTETEANELLPVRAQRANKGSFGKIIVFAGSSEMPGAAALTCSAAYLVGGGLVSAYAVPHVAEVIHHWQREIVTRIVIEKNGMFCKESLNGIAEEINCADVIIAGPGIGRSSDVTEFVRELISIAKAPLVLDADALFAVSKDANILKKLKAPCVITPHPSEMSRLTGISVPDILNNTIETAVNFAKEFNVVTLLKDAHTIIANPDGKYYINTTGTNALSKAGTGDVLTGIIAGFIAQGLDVFSAGVLGAYFHGKAGEDAVGNGSCYSVMAGDLLDCNNETGREQK
jgi:NAD(P)H-hydrate epimerase